MQTERHKIVYLSLVSTDYPLWHIIEAQAFLYQKEKDKFYLLLNQHNSLHRSDSQNQEKPPEESPVLPLEKKFDEIFCEETPSVDYSLEDKLIPSSSQYKKNLLWLEISPHRVMLSMHSNSGFSYHHFWERRAYSNSRYWLNDNLLEPSSSFRLRNYTRHLQLDCNPFPTSLQVQYELWSSGMKLGTYILHLDINNLD